MKWKWFTSLRDRALDRDLEDEMQFHLEMRAAEYERRGASEKEALSAAHRHLGAL